VNWSICRRISFRLAASVDDPAFAEVVRGEFDGHFVAGQNTNVILAHFSRNMRRDDVPVFELNSKSRIRQRLIHDAFHLKGFFFRQRIRFSLGLKGWRIVQKRRW
jgi:hypothetical protein